MVCSDQYHQPTPTIVDEQDQRRADRDALRGGDAGGARFFFAAPRSTARRLMRIIGRPPAAARGRPRPPTVGAIVGGGLGLELLGVERDLA